MVTSKPSSMPPGWSHGTRPRPVSLQSLMRHTISGMSSSSATGKCNRRGFSCAGRQVLSAAEVGANIRDWVVRHRAEVGMCSMCCNDDFRKEDLHPSCGRKGCRCGAVMRA